MAEGFLCGVTPFGVSDQVFDQVSVMNGRVNSLLETSTALATELATYQISNLSFTVDPTVVQTYALRNVDIDVTFDDVIIGDDIDIPDLAPASVSTPAPGW